MPVAEHFSDPLIHTAFAAIDFRLRKSVVAAVSGGSDSLALLVLLQRHLDQSSPQTQLLAVTVDHRLRPESASEAASVAAFCKSRGIAHRTVCWGGEKPQSRISETARMVRYGLLAEAAIDAGTDLVLTGHTADDQRETVAMRKQRGERRDLSGRGLAGIAPATLYRNRVWFVRPLLGDRRDALQLLLRSEAVGWISDPTNVNLRFERARMRARLAESADPAGVECTLLAMSASARRRRVADGIEAAKLIERHADIAAPGLVRLSPAFFDTSENSIDAGVYALRLLIAVTGGANALPDLDRAGVLFRRVAAQTGRATLSGAVIDQRRTGAFLYREWRGNGPSDAALIKDAVFDGRYRWDGADCNAVFTSCGLDIGFGGKAPPRGTTRRLLENAVRCQPCIRYSDGRLADAMSLQAAHRILSPFRDLLSSFDLAPARALAALFGAPGIPESPWRGHIEVDA